MKSLNKILIGAVALMTSAGCEKGVDSYSLLAAESQFKQETAFTPRPVDILWVVDNSGSMASSQTALANNFRSFITEFQNKNFDFNMAVVDTGGYMDNYGNYNYSRFRDGTGTNRSGVYIMTDTTPNLTDVFMMNIRTGTNGTGDERAFSSFEKSLKNPTNAGFLRPGALLVVIVVSDEDDFSHNDYNNYRLSEDYNDPTMFPISHYVNYLTTLTGSTSTNAQNNFVVHTISILDTACLSKLQTSTQKVSKRYQQLAAATGGTSFSLCENMAAILNQMSAQTVELAAKFQLGREPYEDTIYVTVDGNVVPESSTNGWTYDATTWTISFHGAAIPPQGADIRIGFEPKLPQM